MLMKNSIRCLFLALLILAVPVVSTASIILSIGIAPPPLPIYEQPLCPGDGYIWTPGYWAYDDDGGYFWVPGTWVLAPEPGFLWTPGYWGWGDGVFVFHEGYWGPHVGFYGGINYGFGYVGFGYEGGYWRDGAFFYNRSVNHITNITNVYNKTVVVNDVHVSYNGGEGGITARPRAEEEAPAGERHIPPIAAQTQHIQSASRNRELFESVNHGRPAIAATARPGEFSGHEVVRAKSAGPSYRAPTERSAGPNRAAAEAPRTANPVHPNELQPLARITPHTGNAKQDQKIQQQQDKLRARQEQEQRQLQQKQEQEHQRLNQQRASEAQKQKVEQRHQQQTQQLAQRQANEQQRFEARAAKPKR